MLRLLELLEEHLRPTFDRICSTRRVRRRADAEATCRALARSYADDWTSLFANLAQSDLLTLLAAEGYSIPPGYTRAVLVGTALREFRDGEPLGREPSGPSLSRRPAAPGPDANDDDEEAEEDDVVEDLPNNVFEFDENAINERARPYQAELTAALATEVSEAEPGQRLRITVATGGGKTRIANDWIWEHARPQKLRVLWVTKDWMLLRQAAADLCRRQRGAAKKLGYCGATGARMLGALAERVSADVVYTTIHTWRARKDTSFRRAEFDAVIIDESHWGEGKRAYRDLHQRYRDRAVFIGLTATPRAGTGFVLVGEAYDYPRLASDGWLARAIWDEPVRTQIAWSPGRSTSHGDFDRASLGELARSTRRNALIVKTYIKGRHQYGKTLMFACDVEHATKLATLLKAKGVSATELHSKMRFDEQRAAVERFRSGKLRVLVNVAMMTHGVDIPDIETVFLARPTASPTLCAQMVGRAVRKTPTKEHFRLVDFVDNLRVHEGILVSARDYFGELGGDTSGPTRYKPAPKLAAHSYAQARFEHVPAVPGHEAIVGFDLQPKQTYGVEFELTRDDFVQHTRPRDWRAIAKALLEAIPERYGKARKVHAEYHSEDKDHEVWNVEYDSTCGWEVTSRVLHGSNGFLEIMDVCRALDDAAARLGLKVSRKTGTHVHLGWTPRLGSLRRLMRLVAYFEPALYSLVAPSRSGNEYCEPIRKHLDTLLALPTLRDWELHFEDRSRRYLTVNPANLFLDKGTVEVRMHSGTLEGPKILGWLSLWMRILDLAERRAAIPESRLTMRDLPLTRGPQGDVTVLAELTLANAELIEHLRRRRAVVHEYWRRDPDHGRKAGVVAAAWT